MTSQQHVNQWVEGVAVFGDKIYVVCDRTDIISVYQRDSLEPVGSMKVDGLQLPNDMVACYQSGQLYVADLSQCVWRVSIDDGRTRRWIPSKRAPEDASPLSLSVTSRQVLVTSYHGDVLSLYSDDGRALARVTLPSHSKARHAVQTSSTTFVVCRTLPRHDVIEVNMGGHVTRKLYGAELNWPRRLAPTVDGDLVIVDSASGRMLLADGQLRLKRVLLTRERDGLKGPWRLSFSPDTGQMVIGEWWKEGCRITGRVAVFRLICQP